MSKVYCRDCKYSEDIKYRCISKCKAHRKTCYSYAHSNLSLGELNPNGECTYYKPRILKRIKDRISELFA